MKTSSPAEAKQGMTFDITCSQNTEQQAVQNLTFAQHRPNMVTISVRIKKIPYRKANQAFKKDRSL